MADTRVDSACAKRTLVLQYQRGRGRTQGVFLLLGIERLVAQVNRSLRGRDARPVLCHRELRVADFDPDLVFQLLQPHLRLAIFQFRPDLGSLGYAVAQRDGQTQANSFIGSTGIDQLVQRAGIANRPTVAKWRSRLSRIETAIERAAGRSASGESHVSPIPDPP